MDSLCDIVINAETLESAPINPTLQSGASAADLSLRIVYLGARAQRYSHFHEISEQTHKGTFKENSMNPPLIYGTGNLLEIPSLGIRTSWTMMPWI